MVLSIGKNLSAIKEQLDLRRCSEDALRPYCLSLYEKKSVSFIRRAKANLNPHSSSGCQISIAMQQQQQQQTTFEAKKNKPRVLLLDLEKEEQASIPIVDFYNLGEIIKRDNIESLQDYWQQTLKRKPCDLAKIWDEFLQHNANEEIAKAEVATVIQLEAMKKILAHWEDFKSGLVAHNLPQGFYWQKYKKNASDSSGKACLALCFDESYVNKTKTPLTITLTEQKPVIKKHVLSLINSLQNHKEGEFNLSEKDRLLVNKVEILLGENSNKQTWMELLEYYSCGVDSGLLASIKSNLASFAFEKHHFNGLTNILLKHGIPGVALFLDKLKSLKNVGRYGTFNEIFLNNPEDYPRLIKVENLSAWTFLCNMKIDQYYWWCELTDMQKKHGGNTDFYTLSKQFSYFLNQLAELIPEEKERILPFLDFQTNPQLMPVLLDRVLFILQRAAYPKEQLKCLKRLDFRQTGAYTAIKNHGYSLATEFMRLTADVVIENRSNKQDGDTNLIDYGADGNLSKVFKAEEYDFLMTYFRCLALQPWRAGLISDYIKIYKYTKDFDFIKKRCFLSLILATTTSQRASDLILDLNEDVIEFDKACNAVIQHFNVRKEDFWEILNILQELKLLKPEQQLTLPELTQFLLNLTENLPSDDKGELLKSYVSLLAKAGKNTSLLFECAKRRQQLSLQENSEVTPISWECIGYLASSLNQPHLDKWVVLFGLCKEADGAGYSWSIDHNVSYCVAIKVLIKEFDDKVPNVFVVPLLDKLSGINVAQIKNLYSTQDIETFFKETEWPKDLTAPAEIDEFLDSEIAKKLPYFNLVKANNQLNYSMLAYFQREQKRSKNSLKKSQDNLNKTFREMLLAESVELSSATKETVASTMAIADDSSNLALQWIAKIGRDHFIIPFIKIFDECKKNGLAILNSLQKTPYAADPLLPFLRKLENLFKGYWSDINTFIFKNIVKTAFLAMKKTLDAALKERFFGRPPYPQNITFIPFLEKAFSCLWAVENAKWIDTIFPVIKAVFGGLDWFSNLNSFDFKKTDIFLEHLKNIQEAIQQLMTLKIGEETFYSLLSSLDVLKESKAKPLYALVMCLAQKDFDVIKTVRPVVAAYFSYLDSVEKNENNLDVLFEKLDELDKQLSIVLKTKYKEVTGLEILESIIFKVYGEAKDHPEDAKLFLQKPRAISLVKNNVQWFLRDVIRKHVSNIQFSDDLITRFINCLLVHMGELDDKVSLGDAFKQFHIRFEVAKSCLNLFVKLSQELSKKSFLNILRVFIQYYDNGCDFERLHGLILELIELPYELVPSYFNMLAPCLCDENNEPLNLDAQNFKKACDNLSANIKAHKPKVLEENAIRNLICDNFKQNLQENGTVILADLTSANEESCKLAEDYAFQEISRLPRDLTCIFQPGQLELILNEIKSLLDGTGLAAEEKQLLAMDVVQVNNFVKEYEKLSPEELQKMHSEIVENLKKQSDDEVTILDCKWLAIACKLMSCTTDILPNSTQLMVCMFAWRTKGRALFEINTGEGKSYISALLAAREWIRVGTVDVLSANKGLIEQDYKQKKICNFFKSLQIPARTLSADDKVSYKTGYVNYTTVWDRSFKASEINLSVAKGNPYPKAACIFDECDWGLLRMVGITFDFVRSISLDENQEYSWVYAKVLDFINSPDFLRLDDAAFTAAEDLVQLRLHLHTKANDAQKEQIDTFDESQLNMWLDAACQVQALKEGVHFIVLPDKEHQGCFVAVPMIKDEPQLGARFSGAVQPFLHAVLAKKYKDKNFSPAPELACVDTQSSMGLASCYQRLIGLSGTLGVRGELKRLMTRLGASSWSIPPHNHVLLPKKEELPLDLCADNASHVQHICANISALKTDKTIDAPPVLIVEEDINRCKSLLKALDRYKQEGFTVQIVTGEEDASQKTLLLAQAEKSNTITVCTPLFSRGLDLHPTHPQGLQVLIACLKEENVIKQAKGRTRRHGRNGDVKWLIDASRYGLQQALTLPPNKQAEKIQEIQGRLSDSAALERYYTEEAALFREIVLKYFDKLCFVLKEHCENNIESLHSRLLRLRQKLILKSVEAWNNELFKTDPTHEFINPYVRLQEDGKFDTESLEKLLDNYPKQLKPVWDCILADLKKEAEDLNLSKDDLWIWNWESSQDLTNIIEEERSGAINLPVGAPGERSAQPWKWRPKCLEQLNNIRQATDEQDKRKTVANYVMQRFKELYTELNLKRSVVGSPDVDVLPWELDMEDVNNGNFDDSGEYLHYFITCLLDSPKEIETFEHSKELALDCLNLYQIMMPYLPCAHEELANEVFKLKQVYVTEIKSTMEKSLIETLKSQFNWAKKGERGLKYWFNRPLVHDVMQNIWSLIDRVQENNSEEALLALQNALEKHSKELQGRIMLPWTENLPAQIEKAYEFICQIKQSVLPRKTSYQIELLQNPAGQKCIYAAHTGFGEKIVAKIKSAEPLEDKAKSYEPRFVFMKSWEEDLNKQKVDIALLIAHLKKVIDEPDILLTNADSYVLPILPENLQLLQNNIIALNRLSTSPVDKISLNSPLYKKYIDLDREIEKFQDLEKLTLESPDDSLPIPLLTLKKQESILKIRQVNIEKELASVLSAATQEVARKKGLFEDVFYSKRQDYNAKAVMLIEEMDELPKKRSEILEQFKSVRLECLDISYKQIQKIAKTQCVEMLSVFKEQAEKQLLECNKREKELQEKTTKVEKLKLDEEKKLRVAIG